MFCHLIRVQQTSVWTQGSIFEFVHFAPRFCSQIFNQFNIMKHLAEWQFCSWVSITPMKELCSRSVSGENEQGAKPVYWPTFTLAHLLGLWKTVSGMTYDDQTTRQTGLQVLPIYHLKCIPRHNREALERENRRASRKAMQGEWKIMGISMPKLMPGQWLATCK